MSGLSLSSLEGLTWESGKFKGQSRAVANIDVQPFIDQAVQTRQPADCRLAMRAIRRHPDYRVQFGLYLQLVRVAEFRDMAEGLCRESTYRAETHTPIVSGGPLRDALGKVLQESGE